MFFDIRQFKVLIILLITLRMGAVAQTNYPSGNSAYLRGVKNDIDSVTISNGSFIYKLDKQHNVYRYGKKILVPNLDSSKNGQFIDTSNFYGYGDNSFPGDTSFQWDDDKLINNSAFDQAPLFVSPVSEDKITYSDLIQENSSSCNSQACPYILKGADSTLSFNGYAPSSGNYNMWNGEELVDAGDIKGTGTNSKHSQQQLDTSSNPSYCVKKYGKGWRIPTDIEMGHYNDKEGTGNGFDIAYQGTNSSDYLWSCSLFKIYSVKRWPVKIINGEWENCAGFLYVSNRARCVFTGFNNTITGKNKPVKNYVNIYPNPSKGKIKIDTDKEINKIIVYNAFGKIKHLYNDYNNNHIDIENEGKGIYFLKIVFHNEINPVTKKILIQ